MRHHYGLAFFLFLAPGLVRGAEDVPERLLPATTQIYLRLGRYRRPQTGLLQDEHRPVDEG